MPTLEGVTLTLLMGPVAVVPVDGSVGWPKTNGVPNAMTPHGPEIRYAPLGVINANAADEDCRVPFGTLSDELLLYRGGDGQAVFPAAGVSMVDVPARLRVAVMLGETPVAGARVRWSFVGPANRSCRLNNTLCDAATPFEMTTDADGLAEVQWAIDSGSLLEKHQVEAALISAGAAGKPPIAFTASFNVAEKVGYVPPDDACADFANIDNVDAALDVLVKEACKPQTTGGASCCHTVGACRGRGWRVRVHHRGDQGAPRAGPPAHLSVPPARRAHARARRSREGPGRRPGARDRRPWRDAHPGEPNRVHTTPASRAARQLRLDGNVLGWLAIGREQVQRIREVGNLEEGMEGLVFAESFVTRNSFTTAPQLHVANAVTVHGNRFEQSSRLRIGVVSAEVVSATGNLGPPMVEGNLGQLVLRGDPGAKNEAGNARLEVI